jgi:hypothetical protein
MCFVPKRHAFRPVNKNGHFYSKYFFAFAKEPERGGADLFKASFSKVKFVPGIPVLYRFCFCLLNFFFYHFVVEPFVKGNYRVPVPVPILFEKTAFDRNFCCQRPNFLFIFYLPYLFFGWEFGNTVATLLILFRNIRWRASRWWLVWIYSPVSSPLCPSYNRESSTPHYSSCHNSHSEIFILLAAILI